MKDWDAIKGEIYTETGFKWGRFGAFEKWGVIASEAAVVELLCKILGKYYQGGDAPAKPDMPEPESTPETTPSNQETIPTEAPAKSKEDIEKAIKGLQYLADKGNEKAIKAIKGLKYLLNTLLRIHFLK